MKRIGVHILSNKKLCDLYATLKNSIYMENYLLSVTNKKHRNAIIKIRTSSHKLLIEKGRYTKIEKNNRTCPICTNTNNEIEDEFHFTIVCEKYSDLRIKMYNEIATECKHFLALNDKQKFTYILTAEDNISKIFGSFCYNAFQVRKNLLET